MYCSLQDGMRLKRQSAQQRQYDVFLSSSFLTPIVTLSRSSDIITVIVGGVGGATGLVVLLTAACVVVIVCRRKGNKTPTR